jgi:Fe-S-cluster-containing hydrogenase component 2
MNTRRMRSNHISTEYIELITHHCQACWKCIEICPNHVLGKVSFFSHKHARVDNAAACKGCKKCVRVCPNEAILYKGVNSVQESDEGKAISYKL